MDANIKPGAAAPVQDLNTFTDTRDYLAKSSRHAKKHGYADWLIVDCDAHHTETVHWAEVVEHISDPVIRDQARMYQSERIGAPPYGLNGDLGLRYQDVGGRIPHQSSMREPVEDKSVHRDVTLSRRAMEGLAVDYMVVFPTPMLFIGMHPQVEMEIQLCNAYNRWLTQKVMPGDDRIKGGGGSDSLHGEDDADQLRGGRFTVTSTRYKPVHSNEYMPLYAKIQETGKPIAFHAGYHWQDPSLATVNSFLGMHSLGFTWCNIVHMTNWILNGIPERFPGLNSLWIESGLAWIPFVMQRLDDQYLMRQSEAPLLKKMPSDYMRESCFYSCQPMEKSSDVGLKATLEMIKAETQLLFASDWPHFDFDSPRVIYDIPHLSEQQKKKILGLNAAKLFGLPQTPRAKRAA